ncbi:uncharacterized protein PAC_19106 [Phialocephala subalpina]|uniref:Chitin-binding type-1 domain-containing protein n=1 Tax=Phialocephala subalpina TaxID=576137 RepID=A0A1L7XW02_9HELO|nr:uncharacterized protein PAC_19106 [Phialocephala subalpina]
MGNGEAHELPAPLVVHELPENRYGKNEAFDVISIPPNRSGRSLCSTYLPIIFLLPKQFGLASWPLPNLMSLLRVPASRGVQCQPSLGVLPRRRHDVSASSTPAHRGRLTAPTTTSQPSVFTQDLRSMFFFFVLDVRVIFSLLLLYIRSALVMVEGMNYAASRIRRVYRADGRCGKDFDGATCDPSVTLGCCSQFGFCGSTSDFCLTSQGCQSGCTSASTSVSSTSKSLSTFSTSTSTLYPTPSSTSTSQLSISTNSTSLNSTSTSTTSSTNLGLTLGLSIPLGVVGLLIFVLALWAAADGDCLPYLSCFYGVGSWFKGVSRKVRPLGVHARDSRKSARSLGRKKKKTAGRPIDVGVVEVEAMPYGK